MNMGKRRVPYRLLTIALPFMLAASGCASTFMGIDGTAPPDVQQLAARAKADDKQAQFELGIRFEQGQGVDSDVARAKNLYRRAAADSGGMIWIYSPPVGKSPGQVMPVDTGMKQYGLPEARRRLRCLERVESGACSVQ